MGLLLPVHPPTCLLHSSKPHNKVQDCDLPLLYLRGRQKGWLSPVTLAGAPSPPLDTASERLAALPGHLGTPPFRAPCLCLSSLLLAPPLTVWSITSGICISWELLRNAGSQAAPLPCRTRICTWVRAQMMCVCMKVWEMLVYGSASPNIPVQQLLVMMVKMLLTWPEMTCS